MKIYLPTTYLPSTPSSIYMMVYALLGYCRGSESEPECRFVGRTAAFLPMHTLTEGLGVTLKGVPCEPFKVNR